MTQNLPLEENDMSGVAVGSVQNDRKLNRCLSARKVQDNHKLSTLLCKPNRPTAKYINECERTYSHVYNVHEPPGTDLSKSMSLHDA